MINQRIGFCCIALPHNEYVGTKFKSTTLSWCVKNKSKVEQKLVDIYKNNLDEYVKVLNYCIEYKIWIYRISSDLFPLADHEEFSHIYKNFRTDSKNWDAAKNITAKYYELGGRCSTHPGQFCSIGSAKEQVRLNSIKNLEYHADFMDMLDLPRDRNAHINIHLSNGSDPIPLLPIFHSTMHKLPANIISRLTFENEHSGFWTVSNIRSYFPRIPIVFDSLHYICNPDKALSFNDAFTTAYSSWGNVTPVFHHSEGKTKTDDRSHSDYIKKIPDIFTKYKIDIEVEAKAKNLAIFQYKRSLKEL